jgi:hypothetical protein
MLTHRLATRLPLRSLPAAVSRRAMTSTIPRASEDHGEHGSHYDPPGGWLWGIRPGEKYEKEGWETPFFYGFCGSLLLTAVAYAFRPDTT